MAEAKQENSPGGNSNSGEQMKPKEDDSSAADGSSETSDNNVFESDNTEPGDDVMSDVSEDFDCFECKASADPQFDCITIEDTDLRVAETISSHLRASVLVPAEGFQKDVAPPLFNRAFQCCSWNSKGAYVNDPKAGKQSSLEYHILYEHFLVPDTNSLQSQNWRPHPS